MRDGRSGGPEPPIDTSNWFLVSGTPGRFVQVQIHLPPVLNADQALNLAAWIVAVADPAGDRFAEVLEAIRRT